MKSKLTLRVTLICMIVFVFFDAMYAQGTIAKFDLNPGTDGMEFPLFGSFRSPNSLLFSAWFNNSLGLVFTDGTNENTKFLVEPNSNLGNIVFNSGLKTEYHFKNFFSMHTEVGFVFALINRAEETTLFSMSAGDTELPDEPSATLSLEIGNELWAGAEFTVWFNKRSNMEAWSNNVISLFSYAPDGKNFELWKTDGTNDGTVLVKEIRPGTETSWPSKFTVVLEDPSIAWAAQPKPLSAALFFTADDGTNGIELWVTDATEAGTHMVKNINTTGNSFPYALTAMNNKLYFVGATNTENSELWVSDGTEAGTMMIKDINPNFGHSSISELININNILYFGANNGTDGNELWMSDGTFEGTKMIKDINTSSGSNPFGFTFYKNKIYFRAADENFGRELWVTDGTEGGTHIVKDIKPGEESSTPSHFEVFDEMLYFTADDGTLGIELWRTDGTEEGTELVYDIYPGKDSSFTKWYELMAVGDNLFFIANDGLIGHELMAYSNKTTAVEKKENLPEAFKLFQNYPNPFNPSTLISYQLPKASEVTIKIFNTLGQEIRTLVNTFENAGYKSVIWDSKDDNSKSVTSGIYFYEIIAGDYRELRKAVFMK